MHTIDIAETTSQMNGRTT